MLSDFLSSLANAISSYEEAGKILATGVLVVLPLILLRYIHRYHDQDSNTTMRLEGRDDIEHDCVVCLSPVNQGQRYKILASCGHGFHVQCIDAWLQRNSSCPLCRCTVPRSCRPMQYFSISNNQDVQVFEVVASYILGLVDHIGKWLVNPMSPEMMSDLGKNCLSFL